MENNKGITKEIELPILKRMDKMNIGTQIQVDEENKVLTRNCNYRSKNGKLFIWEYKSEGKVIKRVK